MTENLIMEDATVLTIRLTPEELVVLYEHATDPSIELPYSDLLPEYSDAERELVTEVARRGLIARELLEPNEEQGYILHPMALGIVGGSLLADSSAEVLSQTNTEEIGSIEFHRYGDELYVAHTKLPDGLHEFDLFVDEATFQQAILGALQLLDPAELTCPPAQLSAEQLDRAFDQAWEGEADAVLEILNESDLSEDTAQQLASTLDGAFAVRTITMLKGGGDTGEEKRELAFLQGGNGLWHLQAIADGEDEARVSLQPISASESHEKVQALIKVS